MVFTSQKIAAVSEELAKCKSVAISTHRSPDGDAIGSATALSAMLRMKGKQVTVLVPDAVPDFLHWMINPDELVVCEENEQQTERIASMADVIFSLDYNDLTRVERTGHYIRVSNAFKVMIDHHQEPSDFADVTFSDVNSNSTAQMIFQFFQIMGWEEDINQAIAESIYCGIMTDTGSFKYAATTALTHRIIAKLMEKGADHTAVHRRVYDTNTENRLRLQGYAVSEKLVVFPEYRAAYISLTEDELKRFSYQKGDTEGLVNMALSLWNVDMAAFFSEKDGLVKISFRSKGDMVVNTMARDHFSGGGHINAAGGVCEDGMEVAIDRFVSLLPDWLQLAR